jgi:FtsP/CotA-like multicopper oxidase with cupredoxin domain
MYFLLTWYSRNVYDIGGEGTVRLILYNSFPNSGHPMHLHGQNFQVLAEGLGEWDGTITAPSNPSRRDTQILQKASQDGRRAYTVIQFVKNNPGIWPLHCHLAWHVTAGLYVNLVEREADIKKFQVPASVPETCQNWAAFTKKNVPDQIDSGV